MHGGLQSVSCSIISFNTGLKQNSGLGSHSLLFCNNDLEFATPGAKREFTLSLALLYVSILFCPFLSKEMAQYHPSHRLLKLFSKSGLEDGV